LTAALQIADDQPEDVRPNAAAAGSDVQQAEQHQLQQQAPAAVTEEEAAARKARLWKAAIKLPMYSVGYIPVLVRR
jgi:hypothetical protein